jgi:hypothetical protein
VYLDEVSVYSLTASRLGSIATEFTQTEANTLAGEVESSFEGHAGLLKTGIRGRTSTSQEQTSQVLRKSIVQTAFKDLFELESDRLAIGAPRADEPSILSAIAFEDAEELGDWVIDPRKLERGRLLEVEVELDAEPLFRMNAVFSAFLEILQEDLQVFGVSEPEGFAQVQTLNRVLDKLLTGLVPLRGRAVDFVVIEVDSRELIVHRRLLDQLPMETRPQSQPLLVVGVAEQRLFWKDIRRVLFSKSRYRLFCRISQSGLREGWTPVKLADVIGVIVPQFESQLLGALNETTLNAMTDAVERSSNAAESHRELLARAALCFVREVAGHHQKPIDEARVIRLAALASESGGSLETIDERRNFFNILLAATDAEIGTRTDREVAVACRLTAMSDAGLGIGGAPDSTEAAVPIASRPGAGRYLDTEPVAIYW